MALIEVLYSCRLCGVKKAPVSVRERRESESVPFWVGEVVATIITEDHDKRSPACGAEVIDEVFIPFPPGTELGRVPLPN